ncbi:MAG TPA: glycosyltransferase family 39 protein [Chthoniobacterales bacterium]|jgi:membrane-associated phospholipid phosphatase
MNRTGLFIALGVAFLAGLLFAIFPQLDLALARWFYDAASQKFTLRAYWLAEFTRRAAMWIAWALAAPAIIAPILKLFRPRKPLVIPGRAVIFLLSTILLTAIVLPNLIFKEYWGRPRPVATREFQGPHEFKAWWDPRGTNPHNGSFFSGEAATAFWTFAPAALAPPSVRPLAYAAAAIFGLTTGLLRMAFGGHYASDVIAAGVAAFLVAWVMHGLIYRWKGTRLNDERIDQAWGQMIVRAGLANYLSMLVTALILLTVLRFFALRFSVVDLFPDESRYWSWAQTPAFGYYSKPPLIAWIIAAAGHICGSSEACVRAPAPLFYFGTALITYFIARHLYGERAGFWAGLSIALATGAVFSARIISTDVPLLFLWALALLAYVKLLDAPGWRWWVILGLALGFGLLAKYAMIYFVLGALVLALTDPRARAMWRERAIWLALLLAFLVVLPNVIWNATNNFATFQHTRGNIMGSGIRLNALNPLVFLGSQFAVFGPIIFAVFVIALARPSRFPLERADRIMIMFALPPLVLVTLVALVTGAKANWAASSAISMTIVATALLVRLRQWRWLEVSVSIGIVLQVILFVTDGFADRISVPFLAQPDVYHRTMGWKSMSNIVRQIAVVTGARTIVAEQNAVIVSLAYYLRDDKWPILAWPIGAKAANQFEFDRPQTPGAAEPVLFLSDRSAGEMLTTMYSTVEPLPPIDVPTGPHSTRRLFAFKVSGIRPSHDP